MALLPGYSSLHTTVSSIDWDNFFSTNIHRLDKLQRRAIKTALRIRSGENAKSIPQEDLLKQSHQRSLEEVSLVNLGNIAWGCLRNREYQTHPLTAGRIKIHSSSARSTRQLQREFPPQDVENSIMGKITKVWESIPRHLKEEKNKSIYKKSLKSLFKTRIWLHSTLSNDFSILDIAR